MAASPVLRSFDRHVVAIAAISAMAGLLFGYDTGVISGALLFIKTQFALDTREQEWVASIVLIGALVGATGGGWLADRIGRRTVLIWTGGLFILASLVCALAPGIGVLLAGRLLVGIAIGLASFTAPVYISEVSPAPIRGALVSANQLMITIGIVVSYLAGYALSGSGSWRMMFGLAVVPAALLLVGMLFLPESPRWLIIKGRDKQALKALAALRVADPQAEIAAVREAAGTATQAAEAGRQGGGWAELWRPGVRRMLGVGLGLAIFQQITGINTVIYYAPTIFQAAGVEGNSAAILATAGVGVLNVVMTVVAMPLVDWVGRRPLLIWGCLGMAVSLALLSLAFYFPEAGSLRTVAIGCVCLYIASFAIGLGPVFWLLISEIYPQSVRGKAASLATAANWGANFVVALTFLSLLARVGPTWTFGLFAGASVAAAVFVLALVPETKGRTLEEIIRG